MKINRRFVFGLLVIVLLFLTGFLLRDFLLENFVKPIALLLWIGNRLIASIDQAAYWIGLILVLVFISLLRVMRRPVTYEVDSSDRENVTLSSIRHWRTLILLTTDETGRLNLLKNALQVLLKDLYASKDPTQARWKIYEDVERGDITLPESIREFLMLDPPPNARPTPLHLLQRLGQAPARLVRHWTGQEQAEYYQSIAEVISFMEQQLENEDEQ